MADDDVLASDDTPASDRGDQGNADAEYTFEGYTIEFSDLVMLEKREGPQ